MTNSQGNFTTFSVALSCRSGVQVHNLVDTHCQTLHLLTWSRKSLLGPSCFSSSSRVAGIFSKD